MGRDSESLAAGLLIALDSPAAAGSVPIASGNGSRYHESGRGCPRPSSGFAQRLRDGRSLRRLLVGPESSRDARGGSPWDDIGSQRRAERWKVSG